MCHLNYLQEKSLGEVQFLSNLATGCGNYHVQRCHFAGLSKEQFTR